MEFFVSGGERVKKTCYVECHTDVVYISFNNNMAKTVIRAAKGLFLLMQNIILPQTLLNSGTASRVMNDLITLIIGDVA